MKFLKSSLLALSLIIGTMVSSLPNTPTAHAATLTSATQTVTVVGKGELTIEPDIAYINVGASTQEKSSKEAINQNAIVISKIQAALESKGIKKEDVKTVQFSSFPRYEWEKDKNVLKGYQVDHILRVTTRDLDNLGTLVDALTAAGANRFDGIQFDTEKTTEYEGKVLDQAMGHALQKATVLANAAGKKIKGVISVVEMGATAQPINQPYFAMEKSAATAPTAISQGTLTITANITVVYEME